MNLCPICDKKLVGNICPSCKKLIRNPLVIPDGIRLNESHYGNDDMCEFHANDRHIPFINQRHPEKEPECSYHDPDYKEKLPETTAVGGGTVFTRMKPRKSPLGIILAIIVIYFLVAIFMSAFLFVTEVIF